MSHNVSSDESLMFRRCLRLDPAEDHPDLVALERAKGIKIDGGFWSVIPGRNVDNYRDFEPEARKEKKVKKD